MAAMPYGPPTTLADFVQKATNEYGARLVTLDFEVEATFGRMRPRVIERDVDSNTLHVGLPNLPDDVLQPPYVIDALCRRLAISTSEAFGFSLDRNTAQVNYDPDDDRD